eukprot:6205447-Pleurochrysis_carterae.AAC.2
MARDDRKREMAPFMFFAGSVDALATNLQAQPARTHMTRNLPIRRWMSPALLRLVSPSILLVTYHHHLRPNLQTPVIIIPAVRFIWIRDMAILFMASHMGGVVGGSVKLFVDLYVLGTIIPLVLLLAYYHISSSQRELIMSTLSTPSHYPLLGGGSEDWAI